MQLDMFKEYSKSDKRLGDTNMSTLNYRTISDIYHNYSLSTANSNHKRAKVLGQFLTPWDIAENLASHTVEKLGEDITELIILDPFCGDGRMLLAMANTVLEKFGPKVNRISVVGFDVDPQAITSAKETLSILNDADKCGSTSIEVNLRNSDYFTSSETHGVLKADVCITNPPWVVVKASAKTSNVVKPYLHLLHDIYPEAMGSGGFGSISANLARVGFAAALRSLNKSGLLSIVLPTTIMSDQASIEVRRKAFFSYSIHRIETYSAELRKFPGVDQDFCLLIAAGATDEQHTTTIVRHRKSLSPVEEKFSRKEIEELFGYEIRIPDVIGEDAYRLLDYLREFPSLDTHSSLLIYREIDETRISERFTDESRFRFIKGKMMGRYATDFSQLPGLEIESANRFKGLKRPKLVWRDVARRSQYRRMHATIVPENIVAGNSLGCLSVLSDLDEERIYYLGLLNSWVAEFQVRALTHTNHVSTGVVKQLRFPEFNAKNPLHQSLIHATRTRIQSDSREAQEAVEMAVIEVFGLTSDSLMVIRRGIDRENQK